MPNNIITWDDPKDRVYEYGVSKGVHYMQDETGAYTAAEAWNGLTNVTDSPSGADITKLWADGIQYGILRAAEEYAAKIEAYTYPKQFAECDGSAEIAPGVLAGQQERKYFGMCWRSEIGNALKESAGYKLHLAYGLTVNPTEKSHDTINDNPDVGTFSWDASGTPVPIKGYKPSAKLEIDSTVVSAEKMKALEEILYGTQAKAARLPLPDEVITLIKGASA